MTFKSFLKQNIKKAVRLFVPEEKVVVNISEISATKLLEGKVALITGGQAA